MAKISTLKTARKGLARRVNELAAQQDHLTKKIVRATADGDGEIYVDARSDLRDTIMELGEIENELRKLDAKIVELGGESD